MPIIRFRHTTIIRLTLLALAPVIVSLALLAPAHAALEAIEQAYELNPDQILRWPRGDGDSLVVRPCTGCEATTLRVTEDTVYQAGFGDNAKKFELGDMLRKKSRLHGRNTYLVIIFFAPDNNRVNRMVLQADL